VISFAPTPISLANISTIGMISGSLLPPYIDNLTLDVTPVRDVNPVPEPSTFVLGITGLAGLVALRKKFPRAQHAADSSFVPQIETQKMVLVRVAAELGAYFARHVQIQSLPRQHRRDP